MTAALPEWVDREAWAGFVDMRRKTKKPLTDRAEKLLIAKLYELRAAGQDVNACLDQSTVECWAGVFEVKGRRVPLQAAPTTFRAQAAQARNSELTRGLTDRRQQQQRTVDAEFVLVDAGEASMPQLIRRIS